MPKSNYEPVKGWLDLQDRAVSEVVEPWLSIRANAMRVTAEQAESLARIATRPHFLKLPFTTAVFHGAADALAMHPETAAKLVHAVGTWVEKQRGSKRGRVLAALDALFALGRWNDITFADVESTAKREGIDLSDISPKYIKDRVGEMRRMVQAAAANAPCVTAEQIDAQLESMAQKNAPK